MIFYSISISKDFYEAKTTTSYMVGSRTADMCVYDIYIITCDTCVLYR